MSYRLLEKMSKERYFDLVDEVIMKVLNDKLDQPCDTCHDKSESSTLCDECACNKYRNGKVSYKYDPNEGARQ